MVFVLISFGGFTPSYWAPVFSGTFHMPPIAHIHGILLFSWALFYLAQTAWVAAARGIRLWRGGSDAQQPPVGLHRGNRGLDEHGPIPGEPWGLSRRTA